jgi:molybdopterin synthase catalytic subunit
VSDRIQEGPLSLDALIHETGGVDDGALVVFAGNVRAHDAGAEVSGLDYDVHREMAEKVVRRIEADIGRQDGILACRIVHRVGFVPAGEASVYVVVRGRHRPEAFRAAREGIDRVKSEAPIWKEDVHPDGSRRARSSEEGTPLTGGENR